MREFIGKLDKTDVVSSYRELVRMKKGNDQ